jgi:hypothetical protein
MDPLYLRRPDDLPVSLPVHHRSPALRGIPHRLFVTIVGAAVVVGCVYGIDRVPGIVRALAVVSATPVILIALYSVVRVWGPRRF